MARPVRSPESEPESDPESQSEDAEEGDSGGVVLMNNCAVVSDASSLRSTLRLKRFPPFCVVLALWRACSSFLTNLFTSRPDAARLVRQHTIITWETAQVSEGRG